MAEWLAKRPEPVVINYHSITPPVFFGPWSNGIAQLQVAAQFELDRLAPRAALGIAVSHFDEEELQRAGCAPNPGHPGGPRVVRRPNRIPPPSNGFRPRAAGSGRRWLSVGRLAPNKAHQQTIAALFVARATSDPDARLYLVGSPSEPAYARALHRYAAALGLADSIEFVSGITDAELAAYYRLRRPTGHALGPRRVRCAAGGGHAPGTPDRGLRRRCRAARPWPGPGCCWPKSIPGRWPPRSPDCMADAGGTGPAGGGGKGQVRGAGPGEGGRGAGGSSTRGGRPDSGHLTVRHLRGLRPSGAPIH